MTANIDGDSRREERLQDVKRSAEKLRGANGATKWNWGPVEKATPETGYYGSPVLKKPAWTWEVPLYFFVGGAAGAAALLGSVGKFSGASRRLVRDAQWLAAIGGAISPALLISDLGVPSRFLNMLRVFKAQSPMSVGSWTLVAFSGSAAAAATLAEWEQRSARRFPVLSDAAEISAALTGLILSTYTGVLVGASAVPVWNRNVSLLPVHFATSGLAAASAMLELRGNESGPLNALGLMASAAETGIGAKLELHRGAATEPLRRGASGWTMRMAGFLSGPLPLMLRLLSLGAGHERKRKLRRAAAISSIAGSLVTRFAWMGAGHASAKDPRPVLQMPETERKETLPLASDA